jgi:RecA/RadA recombinase
MVYAQLNTMEDIFSSIEYLLETIDAEKKKDIPIVVVVDSVAGATTKIEEAAEYDKDGYATAKAIIISKAMRKITDLVGKKNVTLIFTNQLRMKVGNAGWGDPYCVSPHTTKVTIRYKNKSEEEVVEKMFLSEFSDRFCNNDDFSSYEEFDVSEYNLEIQSKENYDSVISIWNPIKTFIVKNPVNKYYTNGYINCSSNHKILYNDQFQKVKNIDEFEEVKENLDIVDFELGGDHTYVANGSINHNTTSGGKAIGFHSSVRIRLKQMGQIKDKVNGIDQTVGIKTRAQVTKNRIGPPYKIADFDIYFDSGIDEIGSLLNKCKILGIVKQAGAWGTFTNTDNGEVVKFQSKDFAEKVLSDQINKDYINDTIAELSIVKYKPTTGNEELKIVPEVFED